MDTDTDTDTDPGWWRSRSERAPSPLSSTPSGGMPCTGSCTYPSLSETASLQERAASMQASVVGGGQRPAREEDSAIVAKAEEEEEAASVAIAVVVVMDTGRGKPNASLGPLEAEDDEEVVEASERFRSLWEGCSGRFSCRPRRKRGRLMRQGGF